jgi:hypothetical protein
MPLIAIQISRGISEVLDLQSKKGSHLKQTFCRRDLSIHSEISILMLWAIRTGVTGTVDVKQTEVLNFFCQLYASCIQQYCQSLNFKKKILVTPSVGIEPTTTWLKATRSTTELRRHYLSISCYGYIYFLLMNGDLCIRTTPWLHLSFHLIKFLLSSFCFSY